MRQNKGVCGKMLSHGMRRIGLDAGMVEREAVECAGRNADGNREHGQQYNQIAPRDAAGW